ncbi:MAG TPA: hypothetical protein VJK54_08720, partial [Chthoniobacterales bacterium]|nr:hypothetical protein [Chthoniobacterales bacterium]
KKLLVDSYRVVIAKLQFSADYFEQSAQEEATEKKYGGAQSYNFGREMQTQAKEIAMKAEEREAEISTQEKAAKAKAQVSKEFSEASEAANVAWDIAVILANQSDAAQVIANRTKTENAYKEVNRLAQDAKAAWFKAVESKKVILSKAVEADKTSLNGKIEMATDRMEHYYEQAVKASKNAKEAAKQETVKGGADDHITQEIAKLPAETKENAAEATRKSQEARSNAQATTGSTAMAWNGVANRLGKASEYWTKAHSAQESGKTALAAGYREAAAISQIAADHSKQSAQAHAQGNLSEGTRLYNKGKETQAEADSIANLSETSDAANVVWDNAVKIANQASKELSEANEAANAAWDNAIKITNQADAAQVIADRTKTENAYKEVNRLAQDAKTAWFKAIEAKKVVLSKAAEADKTSLNDKIEMATDRMEHYYEQAVKALKNAKEAAKQETAKGTADGIAQEMVKLPTEVKEKIAGIERQIEEAKQASKEKRGGENSYLWDRIATKLEQARDSWNKVGEILVQGKQEKSSLWRKVAEESEVSAESMRKAVISYSLGNKEISEQLDKEAWSAYYASDASTWLLKSEEALEKANQAPSKDIIFWKNLAEQYKIAADYERKALEAHLADKVDERGGWTWAGRSIHSNANYHIKAIEAQEIGKELLVAGYTEAAATFQQAADLFKQSVQAKEANNKSEFNRLWKKGDTTLKEAEVIAKKTVERETVIIAKNKENRIVQEILKLQKEAQERAAEARSKVKTTTGNVAKAWNDLVNSLEKTSEYWTKVYRAEETGKKQLAASYREAAAMLQRAADQYQKSVQAHIGGNSNEGTRLSNEGKATQVEADAIAKKAEEREIEMIAKSTADGISKPSVEAKEKAAEVTKKSQGATLKACEAQKAGDVIFTDGYREVASIFQRAADQYEKAAEYELQAVNAWSNKNDNDYELFDKVGNTAKYSAYQLEEAADAQEEAIKAKKANQVKLTALWLNVAKKYEESADYKRQAADAAANRNEVDFNYFDKKGDSARVSASMLEKQAEELARLKISYDDCLHYDRSFRGFYRFDTDTAYESDYKVNTWASGNDADYDRFNKADKAVTYSDDRLKEAAAAQKKATEAKEANQVDLEALWLKVAKKYEGSAEYKRQAADAGKNKNDIEFNRLDKAGDSARVSARMLEQQADELAKSDVNKGVNKEIQYSQLANQGKHAWGIKKEELRNKLLQINTQDILKEVKWTRRDACWMFVTSYKLQDYYQEKA